MLGGEGGHEMALNYIRLASFSVRTLRLLAPFFNYVLLLLLQPFF
jgi:hypothetical protein